MLSANRGPHAITQSRANGAGFNNGTLYYPTDASLGKLGAMVIVPGFLSAESSIQWWGPRIASHGFVVLTIATNTVTDFPAQRANQQNAALRWLTTSSPAAGRIDPTRLAAGGWSMGGGGSLDAARSNPNIKVVVPMAPWNPGSRYAYNKPTFILSCASDTIATNSTNSNLFYSSLSGEKAQLTIGGSHFCPTTRNDGAAKLVVSWLKRFLDNDTRYSRFVCENAPFGATYRNTCPV
jgi:dienelactone hydrolase